MDPIISHNKDKIKICKRDYLEMLIRGTTPFSHHVSAGPARTGSCLRLFDGLSENLDVHVQIFPWHTVSCLHSMGQYCPHLTCSVSRESSDCTALPPPLDVLLVCVTAADCPSGCTFLSGILNSTDAKEDRLPFFFGQVLWVSTVGDTRKPLPLTLPVSFFPLWTLESSKKGSESLPCGML